MSSDLAKRLLAGESLPAEQMFEAAESLVDLCEEQRKRIAELEEIEQSVRAALKHLTLDECYNVAEASDILEGALGERQ